jgi:hypothetical protein
MNVKFYRNENSKAYWSKQIKINHFKEEVNVNSIKNSVCVSQYTYSFSITRTNRLPIITFAEINCPRIMQHPPTSAQRKVQYVSTQYRVYTHTKHYQDSTHSSALRWPLDQCFPTFVHLCAHWQPISINCTLHISKIYVIDIADVVSNLYVVTVLHSWRVCLFPPLFNFFRVSLNVLVHTPGGTHTPAWKSLP